jgi:hypothetical protein
MPGTSTPNSGPPSRRGGPSLPTFPAGGAGVARQLDRPLSYVAVKLSALAELGAVCADYVSGLALDQNRNFVTLRRQVREALTTLPAAVEANGLVELMLDT